MSRLDVIVAQKRREVDLLRRTTTEESFQRLIASRERPRGFRQAIATENLSVIAEVKRASPSRGILVDEFDAAQIAKDYARGAADAISVLTDREFFSGSDQHLIDVRSAVSVPVLRKEFVIDQIQVLEARSLGADAILLIARLLDDRSLRAFREVAESFDMDALVEAHDATDVQRALDAGASIVGINNRDLATFEVSLRTSEELRPFIPDGVVCVSESGIGSSEDAARIRRAGFDAILVGEGLIRRSDRAEAVRQLKDHASAGPVR